MNISRVVSFCTLVGWLLSVSFGYAQNGPYIGFVYPAGGQQGTTVTVKLGGQRLDGVDGVLVSGPGVTAEVSQFFRKLSNQEMTLIRTQLKELRQKTRKQKKPDKATAEMIERIEERTREYCNRPACASISTLAFVTVKIAPNAKPGKREIRLVTSRGVTNPLVFYVGQYPEVSRKPMLTSPMQVLGKENLAQRKRPEDEVEQTFTVPCTLNGQVASGEINWYRFQAQKGQQLVFSVAARQLIPYIADAVPGWFQPVLAVYDAKGNEVAYNDDFRFSPDPTLMFRVPEDGEYRFSITDAIYRGREDFVYRVTVGESPLITSIFPLGGRVGESGSIEMAGWNLDKAKLSVPPTTAEAGIHEITAVREGLVSDPVPYALDELPECFDQEPNNHLDQAQAVQLPINVNGRIDRQDDWDIYCFEGHKGDRVVAEVMARRLNSPLDSLLRISDEQGRVLAYNDDHQDAESGVNTHHADSYVTLDLPEDGRYYVQLGDAARAGGEAFAYRLRISEPRPDFSLRVVPSAVGLRSKGAAGLTVYALRHDGFAGPIQLSLRNPPAGISGGKATIAADQVKGRLGIKTTLKETESPISLTVVGEASIGDETITRVAVAAEDQMQAFLWRHLVPTDDLQLSVYSANPNAAMTRPLPPRPESSQPNEQQDPKKSAPKFSKRQVQGRLRQLRLLYEDWLLTDDFYNRQVAECEAAL